jgi:hypothetical protein
VTGRQCDETGRVSSQLRPMSEAGGMNDTRGRGGEVAAVGDGGLPSHRGGCMTVAR